MVGALGLDLEDYARGRVLQPIHGFKIARMGTPGVYNQHGTAPVNYGIRRFGFDHYLLARPARARRWSAHRSSRMPPEQAAQCTSL